jgi:hypothetical protein
METEAKASRMNSARRILILDSNDILDATKIDERE